MQECRGGGRLSANYTCTPEGQRSLLLQRHTTVCWAWDSCSCLSLFYTSPVARNQLARVLSFTGLGKDGLSTIQHMGCKCVEVKEQSVNERSSSMPIKSHWLPSLSYTNRHSKQLRHAQLSTCQMQLNAMPRCVCPSCAICFEPIA